jgi:hypothetical protein
MNPLDNMGNILNVKDLVAVRVGDRTLTGIVDKIKEASTIMAEGNRMVPGLITIQVPISFIYNPAMPRVEDLYKMVKPAGFDKPA